MFPIPFNFPFRKKDGSLTTIDDAITSGGGGGGYTLPTASAETKGGVKIGSGLTMEGEVLNNSNPTPYSLPTASAETLGGVKVGSGLSITDGVLSATGGGGSYTPDYVHDVLIIGEHGDFRYYIPMSKEYIGDGVHGYEIETNPSSSTTRAMIDVYKIAYDDGQIVSKIFVKTLIHNSDPNYEDDNISISYVGTYWTVTSKVSLYDESGSVYTSPLQWLYDRTVDYVMLLDDPT